MFKSFHQDVTDVYNVVKTPENIELKSTDNLISTSYKKEIKKRITSLMPFQRLLYSVFCDSSYA